MAAGMEKDLFGDSSAEEEESSEDEFPKPSGRASRRAEKEAVTSTGDTPSSSPSESSDDDDDTQEGDRGSESGEGEDVPTANESQFPSTQDLFGTQSSSDSSDSDGEEKQQNTANTHTNETTEEDEQSKMTKGLFGEIQDMSSSDDDDDIIRGVSHERQQEAPPIIGHDDMSDLHGEVPRIDVEIPRCMAKLGSDQYFVKLPNFLSIETRPFDPSLYEDEMEDEGDFLDEDGRARLKLKVENTIRWRKKINSNGVEEKESNARIVQWTDGSMSLYLGSEIFDIHKQPLQGEFSHLFVRQGTGLQGQAVFKNKLTFRPHSTDSHTHRKMTLSIADRFSKTQKIKVLPVVDKNPESRRSEMIKQEEQLLRESMKFDSQQRRKKEKEASKELSAPYLEPRGKGGVSGGYPYDDEGGVSVSAIKASVTRKSRSRKDSFIVDDDEEEDSEGLELGEDDEEEEEMESEEESRSSTRKGRKRPSQEVASVKAKGRKLLFSDDEDEDSDE